MSFELVRDVCALIGLIVVLRRFGSFVVGVWGIWKLNTFRRSLKRAGDGKTLKEFRAWMENETWWANANTRLDFYQFILEMYEGGEVVLLPTPAPHTRGSDLSDDTVLSRPRAT